MASLLEENKYRNKITYLSILLAIGVVIRHTCNIDVYGLTSGALFWIETYISTLTDVIVPVFFALSGYLFFQNYSSNKLFSKWKSRLKSVVIPYFFWNLIAYLFYETITLIPSFSHAMNSSIEPFTFIWIIKNILFGYHNITWFLRNLIVYILAFPLLFPILKKKKFFIPILILLYVGAALTDNIYLKHSVFFGIGVYIGINHRELPHKSVGKPVLFVVLLAFTVLINTFFEFNTWIYIPVRLLQIILVWYCADILATDKEPKWWMKISFFIYCTHSMILESVEKVIFIVLGKTTYGAVTDLIVAPIITLAVIFLASLILRKNKLIWSITTGGRNS